MPTLNLKDVQAKLPQIIAGLVPGDEVIITEGGQPLARLVRSEGDSWPCQPGTAKGRSFWMAPDFDAPLEDFAEYSE